MGHAGFGTRAVSLPIAAVLILPLLGALPGVLPAVLVAQVASAAGAPAAFANPEAPAKTPSLEPTATPPSTEPPPTEPAISLQVGAPASSPLGVMAALEKAWRGGDIEAVLGCLSSDAVELALDRIRSGPPAGRFARTQAEFLIRDLLHYGETVDFRVVEFKWEEGIPRAQAEWVHRMASGETEAELDFMLAIETGGWRVVRIAAR